MSKNDYWMKRRRYGWGWTPTTKQGWLFIVTQLAILLLAALQLPFNAEVSLGQVLIFLGIALLVVLSLIIVSSTKAPKPHWRWGKKPNDNPDEDY